MKHIGTNEGEDSSKQRRFSLSYIPLPLDYISSNVLQQLLIYLLTFSTMVVSCSRGTIAISPYITFDLNFSCKIISAFLHSKHYHQHCPSSHSAFVKKETYNVTSDLGPVVEVTPVINRDTLSGKGTSFCPKYALYIGAGRGHRSPVCSFMGAQGAPIFLQQSLFSASTLL